MKETKTENIQLLVITVLLRKQQFKPAKSSKCIDRRLSQLLQIHQLAYRLVTTWTMTQLLTPNPEPTAEEAKH